MLGLERGRQLARRALDAAAPRSTSAAFSAGSTPTISRTGRLPRVRWRAFGEPDPSAARQVAFEGGVVGLGRGDDRLVQDPAVDRQPAAVEGLDLVRDRDVGVQVGVAGAGVAVGERGRDQPGDVDLPDPVCGRSG